MIDNFVKNYPTLAVGVVIAVIFAGGYYDYRKRSKGEAYLMWAWGIAIALFYTASCLHLI